jgi:hypothetical protein
MRRQSAVAGPVFRAFGRRKSFISMGEIGYFLDNMPGFMGLERNRGRGGGYRKTGVRGQRSGVRKSPRRGRSIGRRLDIRSLCAAGSYSSAKRVGAELCAGRSVRRLQEWLDEFGLKGGERSPEAGVQQQGARRGMDAGRVKGMEERCGLRIGSQPPGGLKNLFSVVR